MFLPKRHNTSVGRVIDEAVIFTKLRMCRYSFEVRKNSNFFPIPDDAGSKSCFLICRVREQRPLTRKAVKIFCYDFLSSLLRRCRWREFANWKFNRSDNAWCLFVCEFVFKQIIRFRTDELFTKMKKDFNYGIIWRNWFFFSPSCFFPWRVIFHSNTFERNI